MGILFTHKAIENRATSRFIIEIDFIFIVLQTFVRVKTINPTKPILFFSLHKSLMSKVNRFCMISSNFFPFSVMSKVFESELNIPSSDTKLLFNNVNLIDF